MMVETPWSRRTRERPGTRYKEASQCSPGAYLVLLQHHSVRPLFSAYSWSAARGRRFVAVSFTPSPTTSRKVVKGASISTVIPQSLLRGSCLAYLGASFVLTGAAWLVAILAFLATGTLTAVVTGASVALSVGYVVAVFIIPLSMGVWSATATLFGALLYPGSLDTRAGLNGGPIRIVAMLPAMIAVPSVLLLPDHVLPALAAVLAVILPASAGLVWLTARGFRSTRVLGS